MKVVFIHYNNCLTDHTLPRLYHVSRLFFPYLSWKRPVFGNWVKFSWSRNFSFDSFNIRKWNILLWKIPIYDRKFQLRHKNEIILWQITKLEENSIIFRNISLSHLPHLSLSPPLFSESNSFRKIHKPAYNIKNQHFATFVTQHLKKTN